MFLVFIVVIFFEGLTSVLVFTLFHYQNRAKILVGLSHRGSRCCKIIQRLP